MILLAWIASAVFAAPQTLVFRVLKHPEVEFYQCTSMRFFNDLLEGKGNGTSSSVLGLAPEDLERVYSCLFLVAVYAVPLAVIVVTYSQ